jgi:BirA family biotin operon repressor/biotin-[acetyl-CoA-carboxylase] ligase
MLLIKLSAIDSTNAFLKQWVHQTKAHVAIGVRAEYQTHGKGRMGTKWQSDERLNLLCSIYLGKISYQNDTLFEINKRVCLAILDTLAPYHLPTLQIKWPNDILSAGKKIGGVLVEPILRGKEITEVIIGCGINVNQLEFHGLPCASSLRKTTGDTYAIESLFDNLAKNIEHFVRADTTDNARYLAALYGLNDVCSFKRIDGTPFSATITGVAEDGKLAVKHTNETAEFFEEKTLVFTAFSHCQ